MQFETRIVNGKPSIFYKEEPTRVTAAKKLTTKDKEKKKEIRKSMEVGGEIDMVKPSPRPPNGQDSKSQNNSKSIKNGFLAKNGINLTESQLASLLKAIQNNEINIKKDGKSNSFENLNLNLNDDDLHESNFENNKNVNKYKSQSYNTNFDDNNNNDDIGVYRQPQIVVVEDNSDIIINNNNNNQKFNSNNVTTSTSSNANKTSLIDKKKMKWQQDKQTFDKLSQQENHDQQLRNIQNVQNSINRSSLLPRTGHTPEPPTLLKNTLTLAEKKRLQWQQEKEEELRAKNNNKQRLMSYYNDNINTLRNSKDDSLLSTPRGADEYILLINSLNNFNKPTATNNKKNKEEYDKFLTHNGSANDLANFAKQNQNSAQDIDFNILRKSNSLNNLTQMLEQNKNNLNKNFSSTQLNDQAKDVNQIQQQRFSLMDKKKQKWNQDMKDKPEENWPYGKPGVGVGPAKQNNDQPLQQTQNSNFNDNFLPPQPPSNNLKSKKYKEALDEYNRINQTVAAISAAEAKLKREMALESQRQQTLNTQNTLHHDQSRVPAAMRTSINFGDVMFDEDIKRTKELERKKWLAELEEQKKEKLVETQRILNNVSLNLADLSPRELKHHRVSAMSNHPTQQNYDFQHLTEQHNNNVLSGDEEKNFGRTRMLLDPAQIDDMERKKKLALQHKREIDAQIAEKKRIQMLEEEIQALNDLKVENEAKHIKTVNQMNQETKRQQPQYANLSSNLNNPPSIQNNNNHHNTKRETMASVMNQGETNMFDQENSSRSEVSQTRAQEIYRKMQEAELAAAEEKHKRLLKRLQHGGHDTRQLEKKFAELKARLTGNPTGLYNYNTGTNQETNTSNSKFNSFETNSNNKKGGQSMSEVMNHELNLERQKQLLEKQIQQQQQQQQNSNDKFNLSNDQKSKIQQIFQMLQREDTQGLPAELNEENLNELLKTVGRYSGNNEKASRKETNQREKIKEKEVKSAPRLGGGGEKNQKPPIWNYKNLAGRKAIPNSQKDPFYNERAKFIEERRQRRLEYYQGLAKKNSEKYNDYVQKQQKQQTQQNDDDHFSNDDTLSRNASRRQSTASSMSIASNHTYPNDSSKISNNHSNAPLKSQQESIFNLLGKNLAANTIYEEDEDTYINPQRQNNTKKNSNSNLNSINNQQQQILKPKNVNSSLDDYSNIGFVPFMRTNEFLDPTHAGSPIPPSRESSAVKENREKARQAYYQNMKPADFGSNFQTTYDSMNSAASDRNRKKDPLLNNGLVRNNPTPRQEQILSQLASLKQSLYQKQKEVASSIAIENNEDFDMND